MTIDVITSALIGPVKPRAGIISSGRISKFTQKTPSGGIHAVLRIRATVVDDCGTREVIPRVCSGDTYSIQALQKRVKRKLMEGITTHPNKAKRNCERDGNKSARPKLKRVSITP
jgi:hypothetical protein